MHIPCHGRDDTEASRHDKPKIAPHTADRTKATSPPALPVRNRAIRPNLRLHRSLMEHHPPHRPVARPDRTAQHMPPRSAPILASGFIGQQDSIMPKRSQRIVRCAHFPIIRATLARHMFDDAVAVKDLSRRPEFHEPFCQQRRDRRPRPPNLGPVQRFFQRPNLSKGRNTAHPIHPRYPSVPLVPTCARTAPLSGCYTHPGRRAVTPFHRTARPKHQNIARLPRQTPRRQPLPRRNQTPAPLPRPHGRGPTPPPAIPNLPPALAPPALRPKTLP